MDYFESLTAADNTERDAVRSAVVLGKIRYDEQLAPFVRTSKVRLESSLVQSELNRIIAEVAAEVKADPERVGAALRHIIADVSLDSSGILNKPAPREKLPSTKNFGDDTYSEGAPSGKDEKEPKELPGVEHTDVNDHGAVLEDEILEADDQIDITKPLNKDSASEYTLEPEGDDDRKRKICPKCNNEQPAKKNCDRCDGAGFLYEPPASHQKEAGPFDFAKNSIYWDGKHYDHAEASCPECGNPDPVLFEKKKPYSKSIAHCQECGAKGTVGEWNGDDEREACVRCKREAALEDSPVCQVCTDALVALAKKKEALAPQPNTPPTAAPPSPNQPNVPPTHLLPLNSNAPYQCTVCGRVGSWDEINNHLQTALDVPHMTAKQQLQLQDQQIPQMQPQQPATAAPVAPQQSPAYHQSSTQKLADLYDHLEFAKAYNSLGWAVQEQLHDLLDQGPHAQLNPNAVALIRERLLPYTDPEHHQELEEAISEWEDANGMHAAKTAGEYEKQQDQDAAVDSEHAQTPSSHFDYVVENMANRAAARHFSAPTDQDISQIATTYGLDPGEIKQSIQGVATFGNYHGVNGAIGPDQNGGQPPQGYTEVDLNNNGNGIQSHEAVVPMNLAIRKVSEDLNMDPDNVYNSVKSAYGGDLSDEYHTSVQGEFHFYLPQELMAKATQHPQPPAPDQQQQQPPQPGMGQAPGMTPQQGPGMNMPQPDINQMQGMSSVLNDQQLEVLLTRDGKLANQRVQQRRAFDYSRQPCVFCGEHSVDRNGNCANCGANQTNNQQSGWSPDPVIQSPTQEKVSPSYI